MAPGHASQICVCQQDSRGRSGESRAGVRLKKIRDLLREEARIKIPGSEGGGLDPWV